MGLSFLLMLGGYAAIYVNKERAGKLHNLTLHSWIGTLLTLTYIDCFWTCPRADVSWMWPLVIREARALSFEYLS